MKIRGNVSATMLLIAALGSGLAGCADKKVWRTSGQMCQAHGGSYNSDTRQCSFTASSVSGQQACEAQGGVYMAELQRCEFDD
jgi:hypothetical protein